MSAWGCPHDIEGKCSRVNNIPCDLGMKGCVLFGRFRFADPAKNRPKKVPTTPVSVSPPPDDGTK
jgi:hypothetical protein